MRKVFMRFAVTITALALFGSGAYAAATMWFSTDTVGNPIPGDSITLAPGANVQLYCFLESSDIGNTFEVMVGYDKSNATTYGAGVDVNGGEFKKVSLVSTASAIEASMPGSFGVLKSVVMDASGREVSNAQIGGRPYGFVARAATLTNAAPNKIMCFSFTLKNDMTTAGDSQYVVLSSASGGNSYADAWKYGTSLAEDSYALQVVSGSASTKKTYGTTGKSIRDSIMSAASGNYNWVLWGKVSGATSNGFTIDDGSGVSVNVVAPGHSVVNDDYVSVRGSLDLSGTIPTITSQSIVKRN